MGYQAQKALESMLILRPSIAFNNHVFGNIYYYNIDRQQSNQKSFLKTFLAISRIPEISMNSGSDILRRLKLTSTGHSNYHKENYLKRSNA